MQKKYLKHSPKTVALVCMGPSIGDYLGETLTQEYTPGHADEVWVINMSSNAIQHDVVFWMDDLEEQSKFRPPLIAALRKRGKPVITSVRRPKLVPNSYDYPINEIATMPLGPKQVPVIEIFGKPYLNNGVAQAIAYALWKDVKLLKVYGADFSYPNRDYAESGRACVEAWITIASFGGMQIALCPNTSLMDSVKDHGIYGYKDQPEIALPDGNVFQYRKLDNSEIGKYRQRNAPVHPVAGYVPEDSSGAKKDAVQVPVPGSDGSKPRRRRRANGLDTGVQAQPPAPQPARVAG
jgi:hypothetical protein